MTRWPVAALGLGALVIWWPALFGGTTAEQRQIAALEALVTWTETLRDTIAAHASLEQAIPASAVNAPTLIRPALVRLTGQLRARVPLDKALLAFAAELNDPSADLVIAALMLSAKRRGDRLGEVLTGLTTTAREELEMRRKISAGRAELRRGVQIVVVVTVLIGGFLVLFSGAYIAPYGTPAGQLALAVVVGIFAAAFLWMRKLSAQQPVAPFLTRPGQQPDSGRDPCADNSDRPTRVRAAGEWSGDRGDRARRPGRRRAVRPRAAPRATRGRRRWWSWPASTPPTATQVRGTQAAPVEPGRSRDHRAAGGGGGVGGRATDPPRRHPRQPAAGPRPDRPHLRTGHDPEGAVRHRRSPHRAVAAGRGAGRGRCRACRPGRHWSSRCCWPAALFFLPDLEAKADATRRRAEFRHALGAYLDLVALEMAARAAPAEALPAAAKIGTGWPLALIRDTLYRATRAGRDPWAALSDLGQRIGVNELRDLGQLVSLVAHDGARVRSTLTARAHTMRRHELANLQGEAGKADQSMQMAQVLIGLGYLLFIGYPAIVAVLNF